MRRRYHSRQRPVPKTAETLQATIRRAYCPWCREFGVSPEGAKCVRCGRAKDRSFGYVVV
jgi:hypothetical protein